MKIQFDVSEYPNLLYLIKTQPINAKDYLKLWLKTADKLLSDESGLHVQEASAQLNMKPEDVIHGIIQGCLNEQFINEGLSTILGKDLLPIALLTLKEVTIAGDERYYDWRRHFHMDKRAEVNTDTIAKVIGGILKYARFLDFDKLSEALEANQLITFKGLGTEQVKLLPFIPALNYQRELAGDFKVGKFMPDKSAGFFDCGEIEQTAQECKACSRSDLKRTKDGKYIYCRACNAGYRIKESEL